jgi:hypothetical protein
MTIKIGYCPWFEKNNQTTNTALNYYGWADLAYFDLEPLDTWEESTARYHQCPAFVKYVKNTFVLKNTTDLVLHWDKYNKVVSTNLPKEPADAMVRPHWGDFNPDSDRPIVAISNSFVFVADQPVYIEFLPPFNHIDHSWRLIPGMFNIYSWQRPIVTTIEMLADEVILKRGQPMAYIRFRSDDPSDKFVLKKIERTDQLDHAVNSCLTLKQYMPKLSWKIHNTINKLRPKRWM